MKTEINAFFLAISIIAGFVILPSCTRDIDIDLPEPEKKVVVNGVLTAGEIPLIFVSRNAGLNADSQVQYINTAKFILMEQDGWTDTLVYDGALGYDGLYFSGASKKIQAGKKYDIIVTADGMKTVYATTEVPQTITFNATDLKRNKTTSDVNSALIYYDEFNIQFSDNSSVNDFYLLTVQTTDTFEYIDEFGNLVIQPGEPYNACIRTTDVQITQSSDIDFGGSSIFLCDERIMFTDKFFNGQSINAIIQIRTDKNTTGLPYQPSYKVYLSKITESYYNYISTLNLYNQTGNNPFSEPVQVYSNITNGLGIFAAKTVEVRELK